jgi:hypothetical protein
MNGYYECDFSTGLYVNKGEYTISGTAKAPSVHEQTGLSVELLGSNGGYRVYYHDENRTVNQLMYQNEINWVYAGILSNDAPSGLAIASGHTGANNITVAFPKDPANIEISRYYPDKTWHLCKSSRSDLDLARLGSNAPAVSLPRPLRGNITTNETTSGNITLDFSASTNFSLPGWTGNPGGMGVTIDKAFTRNIFYIGADKALHQVANINYVWRLMPDQDQKLWPLADNANAAMATTYNFDSSEAWVYYIVNGSINQLYYSGSDSLWRQAAVLPTFNATAPKPAQPTPPSNTSVPEPAPSQPATNELSTGAKAGIGIGVALGVLALLGTAAAILFLRRRQQQRDAEAEAAIPHDEYQINTPAYAGTPGTAMSQPYSDFGGLAWAQDSKDASASSVHHVGDYTPSPPPMPLPQELEGPRAMYELPQQTYSHELVGEGHYRELQGDSTTRP